MNTKLVMSAGGNNCELLSMYFPTTLTSFLVAIVSGS